MQQIIKPATRIRIPTIPVIPSPLDSSVTFWDEEDVYFGSFSELDNMGIMTSSSLTKL